MRGRADFHKRKEGEEEADHTRSVLHVSGTIVHTQGKGDSSKSEQEDR